MFLDCRKRVDIENRNNGISMIMCNLCIHAENMFPCYNNGEYVSNIYA